MGTRTTPDSDIPEARLDFARRLRELRIPRGFRTARSLARALEIDENRYTRYERAEVEPDLDMIRRICSHLGVSPNDLLGTSNADIGSAIEPRPASTDFANSGDQAGRNYPPDEADHGLLPAGLSIATAAWHLAEIIGQAELAANRPNRAGSPASPLSAVKRTGELYTELMQQPFAAMTAILAKPEVATASREHAASINERFETLIALLKAHAPRA